MSKTTRILGFISCALPIFVALLLRVSPEWVIMMMPVPLDDMLFQVLFPAQSNAHDPNYWAMNPLLTELVPSNISSLEDIFHPQGYPTLVRGFTKAYEPQPLLERLLEENRGKDMKVFNYSEAVRRGYNHISACGGFPTKELFMKFEDMAENMDTVKDLFVVSEAIMNISFVSDLMGGVDLTSIHPEYNRNNFFFGNINKTVVTVGIHCAPTDSLSVQLTGRKVWFFISPEQFAKMRNMPIPVYMPMGYNDDQIIDFLKHFIVVKAGPGDILSFGPNWCHTVITYEGPNVMFNMRYMAKKKLKSGPLSLLLKLLFRKATRTFGDTQNNNHHSQGPIYNRLSNTFDNCGRSNRLEELVARFSNLEW